jgi:hypothetical protein
VAEYLGHADLSTSPATRTSTGTSSTTPRAGWSSWPRRPRSNVCHLTSSRHWIATSPIRRHQPAIAPRVPSIRVVDAAVAASTVVAAKTSASVIAAELRLRTRADALRGGVRWSARVG